MTKRRSRTTSMLATSLSAALFLLSTPLLSCSFIDDVSSRVAAPVERVFAAPRRAEPRAEPARTAPSPPPPGGPGSESRPARVVSTTDRKAIDRALVRALSRAQPGQTVVWRSSRGGDRGAVAPTTRTYRDSRGRQCRDFQSTIHFRNGPTVTRVGTRCRVRGRWVNPN